jgi:hypothetical protein
MDLRFEVLMVVKMSVLFFRVGDGDGMFLQNIGIYLWAHMASQPRKTTLTTLDFIKGKELLDYLSSYQLLKKTLLQELV